MAIYFVIKLLASPRIHVWSFFHVLLLNVRSYLNFFLSSGLGTALSVRVPYKRGLLHCTYVYLQ